MEKLKPFTIKGNHIYIESIAKKEEKYQKYSVIFDILNFIRKYNRKYGTKLNANMIIQGKEETNIDIDILCKNILELLFDVVRKQKCIKWKRRNTKECHGNNILDSEKDISELDENESNKNSKVDISDENHEEVDYAFIEEFNEDENSYSYGNKKKKTFDIWKRFN